MPMVILVRATLVRVIEFPLLSKEISYTIGSGHTSPPDGLKIDFLVMEATGRVSAKKRDFAIQAQLAAGPCSRRT